jgi:hypothetical protein
MCKIVSILRHSFVSLHLLLRQIVVRSFVILILLSENNSPFTELFIFILHRGLLGDELANHLLE